MMMRWGYTTDTSSRIARRICAASGGDKCHTFPIFYGAGEPFYFESIWRKDEATGKDGVRGPILLSNVQEWVREDPKHHQFSMQPLDGFLPLSDCEVGTAFNALGAAVHLIHYAKLQLAQNWVSRRLGVFVHWGEGSVQRWTCSETDVRILPGRVWPYFNLLNFNADDFAPSGTNGPSVEEATRQWIAAEGVRQ